MNRILAASAILALLTAPVGAFERDLEGTCLRFSDGAEARYNLRRAYTYTHPDGKIERGRWMSLDAREIGPEAFFACVRFLRPMAQAAVSGGPSEDPPPWRCDLLNAAHGDTWLVNQGGRGDFYKAERCD